MLLNLIPSLRSNICQEIWVHYLIISGVFANYIFIVRSVKIIKGWVMCHLGGNVRIPLIWTTIAFELFHAVEGCWRFLKTWCWSWWFWYLKHFSLYLNYQNTWTFCLIGCFQVYLWFCTTSLFFTNSLFAICLLLLLLYFIVLHQNISLNFQRRSIHGHRRLYHFYHVVNLAAHAQLAGVE